jgi:hypothetical protein
MASSVVTLEFDLLARTVCGKNYMDEALCIDWVQALTRVAGNSGW